MVPPSPIVDCYHSHSLIEQTCREFAISGIWNHIDGICKVRLWSLYVTYQWFDEKRMADHSKRESIQSFMTSGQHGNVKIRRRNLVLLVRISTSINLSLSSKSRFTSFNSRGDKSVQWRIRTTGLKLEWLDLSSIIRNVMTLTCGGDIVIVGAGPKESGRRGIGGSRGGDGDLHTWR